MYSNTIFPGAEFVDWTVVEYRLPKSICQCTCGRQKLVDNNNLRSGKSKWCLSCGRTGNTNSRRDCKDIPTSLYVRMNLIVMNVFSSRNIIDWSQYKDYAGRGIKVYPRWVENKYEFIRYLSRLPGCDDSNLVIDRRDNDSGYVPGNLQFVTWSESNKNRRQFGHLLSKGFDGKFIKK